MSINNLRRNQTYNTIANCNKIDLCKSEIVKVVILNQLDK